MKRPLVVVTGLPGAGKSTLLQRLGDAAGEAPGILVRQAGPSRRRGVLSSGAPAGTPHAWEPVVTVPVERSQKDPSAAIGWGLFRASERNGKAAFLETAGNFDPSWIAEAFAHWREPGETVAWLYSLRRIVCVLDARRVVSHASSRASLSARGFALNAWDARSLAETFFRQVEGADVVVLNRVGRVAAPRLATLAGLVRAVNPLARVVTTEDGHVDPALLVAERVPPQEGLLPAGEAFTWVARRPVHPRRFWEWIHESPQGLLRVRGYFWMASRPDRAGIFSQAGATLGHGPGHPWWATVPVEKWPMREETLADIAADWDPATGDRRQELLLAGIGIDRPALERSLEACLLDDAEMAAGPAEWARYEDPFPDWDDGEPDPRASVDALSLN